jgi:hypothetical protein
VRHQQPVLSEDGEGEEDVSSEEESSEDDTPASPETSEGLGTEDLGDDLPEDLDDDDDYANPRKSPNHWKRVNVGSYNRNHPELGEEFEIRKSRVKEMVQVVLESIMKYTHETPYPEKNQWEGSPISRGFWNQLPNLDLQ